MQVGATINRTDGTTSGGVSEAYIFGETEAKMEIEKAKDTEIETFVTLKRESVHDAYARLFGGDIEDDNERKMANYEKRLEATRERIEAHRAVRAEYAADLEAQGLTPKEIKAKVVAWNKANKEPKYPNKPKLKTVDGEEIFRAFENSTHYHENMTLDFEAVVGGRELYDTVGHDGEPTGLTEAEALENRKKANRVISEVASRWNDEFPQLPLIQASIHNDTTSPHGHFKAVPVAFNKSTQGTGFKVAPGLHTALEQMGMEVTPDLLGLKSGLEIGGGTAEANRMVVLYRRLDDLLAQEMALVGWEKVHKGTNIRGKEAFVEADNARIEVKKAKKQAESIKMEVLPELSLKVDKKKEELKEAQSKIGQIDEVAGRLWERNKQMQEQLDLLALQKRREEEEMEARRLEAKAELERAQKEKEEIDREWEIKKAILAVKPDNLKEVAKAWYGGKMTEVPAETGEWKIDAYSAMNIPWERETRGLLKTETDRVLIDKEDFDGLKLSIKNYQDEVKHLREFGTDMIKEVRKEQEARVAAEAQEAATIQLYESDNRELRLQLQTERQRNGFDQIYVYEDKNKELDQKNRQLAAENKALKEENTRLKPWKDLAIYVYKLSHDHNPIHEQIDKHIQKRNPEFHKKIHQALVEAYPEMKPKRSRSFSGRDLS